MMKRILAFLLVLFLWVGLCSAQSYELKPIMGEDDIDGEHPLGPKGGLVGAWLLNEGGGNLLNDLSGNGNTGTIVNALWTGGNFGPSLNLDGTGDYITCGANVPPNFTTSDFTLSVWLYSTSATTEQVIFCRGKYGSDGFYLEQISSGIVTFASCQGAAYQLVSSANGTLPVNRWSHLCFVRSGTVGSIFLNGTEASYTLRQSLLNPRTNTRDFRIGSYYDGSTGWIGKLDIPSVYNRALTAGEIAQLCRNPLGMYRHEQPELYVTAAAPPATGGQVIIIAKRKIHEAAQAGVPALIPIVAIGAMAWAGRKRAA